MLKKTITYTDFEGNQRTEDYYFNLSKTELMRMELSTEGGLGKKLEGISKSENVPELIKMFEMLIKVSYGVKSDDGKKFVKNEKTTEDFINSAAYDELFMSLITNTDEAIAFFKSIMPGEVQASLENDDRIKELKAKANVDAL